MKKFLVFVLLVIISGTIALVIGLKTSEKVETEDIIIKLGLKTPIKILQLSDFHYPKNIIPQDETFSLIKTAEPDMVVMTGDIFDASVKQDKIRELSPFLKNISSHYPCFFVIGNHEIGSKYLDNILEVVSQSGITVLSNGATTISLNGVTVELLGLTDSYAFTTDNIRKPHKQAADFRILLSHRPEKFESYALATDDIKPQIVFAGHAHGGMVRLGNQGFYAPHQGFFPRYTSGLYENNGVYMVVSRGLGVSGANFRVFNRIHIPIVTVT